MKKVVLIGDSIRMIGYGKPVAERLCPELEVWQPDDNCRFASYTLRGMWDWQENMRGADIIHWNNGLWDVCQLFGDGAFTPIDEYVSTMLRIAGILKERAKTVIFATTTPVRKENPHNKTVWIEEYNAALVPKLKEKGIIINDLFSLVAAEIPRYVSDDLIHLSKEGIELCADAVEKAVRDAEKLLEGEKETVATDNKEEAGAPVLFDK